MKYLFLIIFSTFLFTFSNAQIWEQSVRLTDSHRDYFERFGNSVAISGNYAIVGSFNEAFDENESNGIQSAGAAFIFERTRSGTWELIQKIVPSDRQFTDVFGSSVSIYENYAIVGAVGKIENWLSPDPHYSGAAYIFERNNDGIWEENQKLLPSDFDQNGTSKFGYSVSIHEDVVIIGAIGSNLGSGGNYAEDAGAAYIFEKDATGNWKEVKKLLAFDGGIRDEFGRAVSIYGKYAAVGTYLEDEDEIGNNTIDRSGSVYMFEKGNDGIWNFTEKLNASDRERNDYFGTSVSISEDYLIIGAPGQDEDPLGNDWVYAAGSVYVFKRNDALGNWEEVQQLTPDIRKSPQKFGQSVFIDGDNLVIGAIEEADVIPGSTDLKNAGAAYIFHLENGIWTQEQRLVISERTEDDFLGNAVAISGDFVLVAAAYKDEPIPFPNGNIVEDPGVVYVFEKPNSETFDLENPFIAFPNPTTGNLTIDLGQKHSSIQIRVMNSLGQTILTKKVNEGYQVNLQIEGSAGIYFIEVSTDEGDSNIIKVIKR